jgi:hypothetical protein
MKICRAGLVVGLFLAITMTGGCATSGQVKMAGSSFQKAGELGAEQKAPYEYYAAEAYLEMAEHEVEEGDTKQAAFFADKAGKFAEQAIEKSGGVK